jgi:hypothetical protein
MRLTNPLFSRGERAIMPRTTNKKMIQAAAATMTKIGAPEGYPIEENAESCKKE